MGPKQARVPAATPRGFTLLELLVVVVIIGLLAGFVAPRYFGQVGKSEVNVARAQIDALEKALDQYRLDVGRYPSTELGLKALVERPANEPKWNGPYLQARTCRSIPGASPTCTRCPARRATSTSSPTARTASPAARGENADIDEPLSGRMRFELKAIAPGGGVEALDFQALDEHRGAPAGRGPRLHGARACARSARSACRGPAAASASRCVLFSQELLRAARRRAAAGGGDRDAGGEGAPRRVRARVLERARRDAAAGPAALGGAASSCPQAFPPLYVATVRASERTSDLRRRWRATSPTRSSSRRSASAW